LERCAASELCHARTRRRRNAPASPRRLRPPRGPLEPRGVDRCDARSSPP
jgi:hypothetical protein